MSCGISFIKNSQIYQLKSMVQNLITEHQLILHERANFNVLNHLQSKLSECAHCEQNFNEINKMIEKMLSDVSNQLIGLGSFAVSVLDNLNQISQANQQSKDSLKHLQNRNLDLETYISEIQNQNQTLKGRVIDLEEIVLRTDKQISEIQLKNQQLKSSKILLENQLFMAQNSLILEKKSQILHLEQELIDLKQKHLVVTNQKQILQKQVICLNQELKSQSLLQNIHSSSIKKSSIKSKRGHQNFDIINYDIDEQRFHNKHNNIYEFHQSPSQIQTKSSLQRDIGSDKTFNFCIYSPAMSNTSIADHLKIQSRKRDNLCQSNNQSNKENINTINKNQQISSQKLHQKQNINTISLFTIQKHDKQTQTTFLNEIIENQMNGIVLKRNFQSLYQQPKLQSFQIKLDSTKNVQKMFNLQDSNISLKTECEKPIFFKLAKYLTDVCIKNRIKIKNKSLL